MINLGLRCFWERQPWSYPLQFLNEKKHYLWIIWAMFTQKHAWAQLNQLQK